jgi:hypothetical protein
MIENEPEKIKKVYKYIEEIVKYKLLSRNFAVQKPSKPATT